MDLANSPAAVMPHKHWQYAPKSNGVIIDRIKEENNLNTIPEEGQLDNFFLKNFGQGCFCFPRRCVEAKLDDILGSEIF